MSEVRVCTLMWGTAWERFGEDFAKSFQQYWDPSIEVNLVTDKLLPFDRARQIWLDQIDDYNEFMTKWKDKSDLNDLPIDRDKIEPRHFWKHDAVKWIPQVVTPKAVLQKNQHWVDGDIFVWLDADVVTTGSVDKQWIEKVLGDYDCACLQRKPVHTEIGFYALRLNEHTRAAMDRFSQLFVSFEIFNYEQQHSAYAWDIAIDENPNIRVNNLNKTNDRTHVFPLTVLNEKLIHNKGHRKPGGG